MSQIVALVLIKKKLQQTAMFACPEIKHVTNCNALFVLRSKTQQKEDWYIKGPDCTYHSTSCTTSLNCISTLYVCLSRAHTTYSCRSSVDTSAGQYEAGPVERCIGLPMLYADGYGKRSFGSHFDADQSQVHWLSVQSKQSVTQPSML